MKRLLTKVHPIVPSIVLLGTLFAVAFILSSCGTHYVQCDAYGDSGENHKLFKDEV